MTRKQRVVTFRKREREHVKAARYFMRSRDYVQAIQRLAWALQQATAADEAGRGDER